MKINLRSVSTISPYQNNPWPNDKAFLMELDPLYCDVIVQRFEKLTGKKAERIPAPEEAKA